MSAGNPVSTNSVETGQHPWPRVQSPPHLANQLHLLHLQASSHVALCSDDLRMSWALLFPFLWLKCCPLLSHFIPSLLGKILLILHTQGQMPAPLWSLLLQPLSEIVPCLWLLACQQHSALYEGKLSLFLSSYFVWEHWNHRRPCGVWLWMAGLNCTWLIQKSKTCPTCFLAHSRSKKLLWNLIPICTHAVYFSILLTLTECATSFTHQCLCTCCSLWLKYPSLLFSGKIQLQVRLICAFIFYSSLWWCDSQCAVNKAGFPHPSKDIQPGKQANSCSAVFKSSVDSQAPGFSVVNIQIV